MTTCELCNLPGADREIPRGTMYGDTHHIHTFCARIEGLELLKGAEREAWLAAERAALTGGPVTDDPILEIVRSLSLSATLISETCSERLQDKLDQAFLHSPMTERDYAGACLTLTALTVDAWQ